MAFVKLDAGILNSTIWVLRPDLETYMVAFGHLSTCRHHGMGLMAIPWDVIQRYADVHNMNAEETYDLHYIIRGMDNSVLAHLTSKIGK